jgi:hypothetical protein
MQSLNCLPTGSPALVVEGFLGSTTLISMLIKDSDVNSGIDVETRDS